MSDYLIVLKAPWCKLKLMVIPWCVGKGDKEELPL
jgi:hypothetical protein